eukprot:7382269-Prymnesium_polylepis.1
MGSASHRWWRRLSGRCRRRWSARKAGAEEDFGTRWMSGDPPNEGVGNVTLVVSQVKKPCHQWLIGLMAE